MLHDFHYPFVTYWVVSFKAILGCRKDYLATIKETMARMDEINRLIWEDIDFDGRALVPYTRKKKGGHLTPKEGAHDHQAP
jgi:integrase